MLWKDGLSQDTLVGRLLNLWICVYIVSNGKHFIKKLTVCTNKAVEFKNCLLHRELLKIQNMYM